MNILRLFLTLIMVFAVSVSCKKDKLEYGLKLSETLRINILSEPPSLDWTKSTDTTSAEIQDNIMEGLAEYNFDDPELSLKPGLATEWTATNNAKKWEFTIRKGVKWTDGVELTPQHIIDGWERLLNPNTASEYAYFLYGIKNARQYNQGVIKDFSKVGVKVDAKGKLIVELEAPQSYFPYLLAHHCTYPIRVDVIKKHGNRWTDPKNIVTLGPFFLKLWKHDKAIVLERNESYYGEKPKIKNVLAYMINELSTAISLFDSGQLDAQVTLPSTELPHLKRRKEFQQTGILSLYYYGFNVKKPPLDNPLVRKAISMAINQAQVTDMLNGGQTPLTSWVPPGMFGYESELGLNFDVAKAKSFLKKAGYSEKNKFPKLTMAFNTLNNHQRIAENVQAQLKKNLGINLEIQNEEWKVYLNTLKTNPPHIFRMGWVADFPDPDNFLGLMTSFSDNNHTGWGNPKFDKLINQAVSETSKKKRRVIYQQAQKILTEVDAAVVPILASVSHSLVSERVINFPNNVMYRKQYKKVQLK